MIVLDDQNHIEDGQQRLATVLLLASEIYEAAQEAKRSGMFDSQLAIDAEGAVTPALRQLQLRPRDQPHNQGVLLKRAGVQRDSPESTKRLAAARKRLKAHLSGDLSGWTTPDAKLARLKQWGEYSWRRLHRVLRDPPRAAHNIFEILNTRGVRLSNGDLVKSHLIGRSTDASAAVTKWNQVKDALKGSDGRYESDLETFLLHYSGSRYHRTTKREFFADYRKALQGVDSITALDTLLENAKIYRSLAAPQETDQFWTRIGTGTRQAVESSTGSA